MLAAMEVLPVLAAKLPATDWAPLFQRTHAPLMLKLCQPSQPDDIRAAAIGLPAFYQTSYLRIVALSAVLVPMFAVADAQAGWHSHYHLKTPFTQTVIAHWHCVAVLHRNSIALVSLDGWHKIRALSLFQCRCNGRDCQGIARCTARPRGRLVSGPCQGAQGRGLDKPAKRCLCMWHCAASSSSERHNCAACRAGQQHFAGAQSPIAALWLQSGTTCHPSPGPDICPAADDHGAVKVYSFLGREVSVIALKLCKADTSYVWPQALHPLFSSEEEDGVRDNAIGAAARIISAQAAPQQLLPQVSESSTAVAAALT